ncbi:hypothetical protein LINPERHAP1_LOCUS30575 [Linum perenne]
MVLSKLILEKHQLGVF